MDAGKLAPVAVSSLISALAYGAQLLFMATEPGPLSRQEATVFNVLVGCLWVCYARTCFTEPGFVPSNSAQRGQSRPEDASTEALSVSNRWCRKCENPKPPRAHHCKSCRRCIPKMDHHCVWASNCVSHRTFPHFMRFLLYAVTSMIYLGYFLFVRAQVVWDKRDLPSYLGPSVSQLISLFLLLVVNFVTCCAVGIILLQTLWSLWMNITSIESWEIERHEALVQRARRFGGYLDGPDGVKVRIRKQEFPYDIGIWSNLKQGMGQNPLTWLWPFAGTPANEGGLHFEVNGFEDPSTTWPPPDPDKLPRRSRLTDSIDHLMKDGAEESDAERVINFRKRQQADFARSGNSRGLHRRLQSTGNAHGSIELESPSESDSNSPLRQGQSWRSAEDADLADYGVDVDTEFRNDEHVPLGN